MIFLRPASCECRGQDPPADTAGSQTGTPELRLCVLCGIQEPPDSVSYAAQPHSIVRPEERVLLVVGSYGSGKTEVAVNLAMELALGGRDVQLADLDLVNPYFRSREARELLESAGVHVISPSGAQAFADLPIVLPEIRGLFNPPPGRLSVFDVGGDDVGARALASFRCAAPGQLRTLAGGQRPPALHQHRGGMPKDALGAGSRFALQGHRPPRQLASHG